LDNWIRRSTDEELLMSMIQTAIADNQIQALAKRTGESISSDHRSPEAEDARVSRSTIRTWAVQNGDMRPLYTDPEYASGTRWKTIIAPPAAIMAFEQVTPEIDCLPGSFPVLHAARLEFVAPIRMNDIIAATSQILKVEEISSPHAGRVVSTQIATKVTLRSGEPVGSVLLDWHLYERGTDAHRSLFDGREVHMYGQEDIEALSLEYTQEAQRGASPLHFEDAAEGDELPTVLKGPTTRNRYVPRVGDSWYWGHKQGWNDYRERPELFFLNENDAPEPIMATDWDHHRAARWGGLPGALEGNTDRPHFLVELLLNWMGDSGFPKLLDLQFPKQNLMGDICRSHGRVKDKRREGDCGIVVVEMWQINQRGESVTTGYAEAELPLKQ
jgi:acyl dehydratase